MQVYIFFNDFHDCSRSKRETLDLAPVRRKLDVALPKLFDLYKRSTQIVRILNLENCYTLTDQNLLNLCNLFSQSLQHLNIKVFKHRISKIEKIQDCRKITSQDFLAPLTSLEYLNISNCTK